MGFIQSYIKLSERCSLIRCRKPYILQIPCTLGVKNMVKKIKSPIEFLEAQVIAEAQAEKEATVKAWIKNERTKISKLYKESDEALKRYTKALCEYEDTKALSFDELYDNIKGTPHGLYINCSFTPGKFFKDVSYATYVGTE
jgi:hypothetical protein